MLGRLNHVAIAVKDYFGGDAHLSGDAGRGGFRPAGPAGAWRTRGVRDLAQHQDRVSRAAGAHQPIAKFLEKNPDGGMHHICYEVSDIRAARDSLIAGGLRILGDGEPKIGAHGKPVLFLHPKDCLGTLTELEEV